jgi:hypothetical protein
MIAIAVIYSINARCSERSGDRVFSSTEKSTINSTIFHLLDLRNYPMNLSKYSDSSTEQIFNIAIVMIATLAIGMVAATGQDITRSDLIDHPAGCQHVIDLVNRHGVNQTFDHVGAAQHLQHSPFGSMMIPASEMGDLRIISVHQIADDNLACGPRIAVVIENQSNRCVESFSGTAVATLGRMHCDSPNTTVNVAKIKPCEAMQVELVLPIEALAMGNRGGQVIGFQRLVIAIDSFDELAETDEANNIKAFAIASLPTVAAASVEVMTSESVSENASASAVQQSPTQAPVNTAIDPLQSAIDQLGISATASDS